MKRLLAFVAVLVLASPPARGAAVDPALWTSSVPYSNAVVSAPVLGGGYPVPDGATAPVPGTCGAQWLNSNRSESWIAVKPGTEDLIGVSKFFIDKWSTFYNFHDGSYTFENGALVTQNQIQGYECTTLGGSQDMPPSWTNNTDPQVDFDTQGRAYQTTLPFNAYWVNLHPNSAIMLSYSDDLGRTWITGNGGKPLEHTPNWSSLSFGFVEDKQWTVVNKIPGHRYQDHVYAVWSIYNGNTTILRIAVSRDRGQSFSKATTLTMPSKTGPSNQYIFPAIDAAGVLYVSFASLDNLAIGSNYTLYVAKSTDDGRTFGPFVAAAVAGAMPGCCLPNTTFRDGVAQSLAASPDHAGHLYMAYESWDHANGQMDVYVTQSTDSGASWSAPAKVNDNAESAALGYTDQFQPSIAAGPGGAVAVAFYDRRVACPSDASIRPQDVGRANFCIDTTLQAYKDTGTGAAPVLANVRITDHTWDPMQPDQHVDGTGQMACAGHRDPCTSRAFIGDYFGLAVSGGFVYALFVSTHYPSTIAADEGGPVYYQQQVLAKVARSAFGAGY